MFQGLEIFSKSHTYPHGRDKSHSSPIFLQVAHFRVTFWVWLFDVAFQCRLSTGISQQKFPRVTPSSMKEMNPTPPPTRERPKIWAFHVLALGLVEKTTRKDDIKKQNQNRH
jgi:hypothetical protein